MVAPVVHALRQDQDLSRNKLKIRVLALPAAKAILDNSNVESFTFTNYLDKEIDTDAIKWGEELTKVHHSPSSGIDIRDSIAYLGLSYKDLVLRLGQTEAKVLVEKKGRHAFYPLTIMERIFDDVQPDFVVTTNSPRSEAAAIETANQRGVDNMIMTDLFTGLGDYTLKAKNISFLNRFAKDMFARDGLVDEELSTFHFTGNPAFDRLLSLPRDEEPGWLSRNFAKANGNQSVLHADIPAYWDPQEKCSHFKSDTEFLEELDAAYDAAVTNGAIYLIRPHPSQELGLYSRWIKNRKNAYLAVDIDLHTLLRNISLLLVRTSTVGLEAAYLQKRVLQLDCDFHTDLPLEKMGIAWGVNSYDKLADEVENALGDSQRYVKIKKQIRKVLPHEPAADKLARIVLEKLSKQK